MKPEEFARHGHALIDWIARYMAEVEEYPVRSRVSPGEILSRLPEKAPEEGEPLERVFRDFERIILPGMTHWNHPSFFGYFPANNSGPSILGELLTAGLGAQCMVWQTSPAATELEERVLEWLRDLAGLPPAWSGVIQDTASTGTLCALLSARERATGFQANRLGMGKVHPPLTVYASAEVHSSIPKDVRIAGYGEEALRLVSTDEKLALDPAALEEAVGEDKRRGLKPACVVATLGTTSTTAFDPLEPIGRICREEGIWLHVDAALAGSAAILPEMRWMLRGVELADSFVFNPHKWLFTNFDCSAYYVADPELLVRTLEIHPEYLRTGVDARVRNYRDWGIALGRRFRALKLWFVLRYYGGRGLRERLREHVRLARLFARWVDEAPAFLRLAPVPLNLVCFRYHPAGRDDPAEAGEGAARLERVNQRLLEALNETGRLFLTHTRIGGVFALRMSIGQTYTEERHVREAWDLIQETARRVSAEET